MRIARLAITAVCAALAVPAFALGDARVERVDPHVLRVAWTSATPVDVYVSERPDATMRTARLVSHADGDGLLDYPEPSDARVFFLLHEARGGQVLRTAERLIPLAQGSNFRDVGGYAGAGGRHVRWGAIYRSGATPLLTDGDVARVRALGLTDIVDLRSSEERVLAPTRLTGIRYTAIDYSMTTMMGGGRATANGGDLYRNFPAFFAPQLRVVFDDLLRRRGPIVYHCSAGQDRTGFATAMVLSALGVPRATIIADYHLSTAFRRPEYELPKIDAATAKANPVAAFFAAYQASPGYAKPQPLKDASGRAFLDSAFAEIDTRWGSVDAYLAKEVGVSARDLAALRANYLE